MSIQMPYQPDDQEQQVLDVLKDERQANPFRIREVTGLRKQYVNDALRQLEKAEYIEQVTRGLYRFVKDPNDDVPATVEIGGADIEDLVATLEYCGTEQARQWAIRLREEARDE